MTAVPPEAEDAILQAIEDNMPSGIRLDLGVAMRLAAAIWEAAAPLIAAAERDRIRQLAEKVSAVYFTGDLASDIPFAVLLRGDNP